MIERPSYGYELARRFQRVYGDTLVLSNTLHIYRLLDALISHALIEEVNADGRTPLSTGRRGRYYRASAQGARAYKEWLVNQPGEGLTKATEHARAAGNVTLTLKLLHSETGLLERHHGRKLMARIHLRFTPTNGTPINASTAVLIG